MIDPSELTRLLKLHALAPQDLDSIRGHEKLCGCQTCINAFVWYHTTLSLVPDLVELLIPYLKRANR